MNLDPDQLAVTAPAQRAIAALDGGAAWQLFLDKLSFERGGSEDKEPAKTRALRDVCKIFHSPSAQSAMSAACASRLRWLDSLEKQICPERFRRITLVSDSRLLLHLGRASVLENVGLYCDRTTGLPIIPGTALKGVLSTWSCWEANESSLAQDPPQLNPQRRELAQRIFGDNATDGSEHAGDIVFLGAFPAEPERLPAIELDIVTPHPDNGRGRILPNVFLAFSAPAAWRIVFFAKAAAPDPAPMLGGAAQWLGDALSVVGLGAKTAAGYGRFRTPTEPELARIAAAESERAGKRRREQETLESEKRLAELPPEERAYEAFVASQSDWVALARDVASRPDEQRQWILRFFRSERGAALLKTWTNEKGGRRIEALKNAGL